MNRLAAPPVGGRNTRAVLRFGWDAARPESLVLVALQLLVGIAPVVSAYFFKRLVDELAAAQGVSQSAVVTLAALAGAAGLAGGLLSEISGYVRFRLGAKVGQAADAALFDAVMTQQGIRHLEDPDYLDQLHLANQVAGPAVAGVVDLLAEASRAIARIIGFAGAVVLLWPPALLGLVVVLAPQYFLQRWQTTAQARLQRVMGGINRQRGQYKALLTDVRSAREVRAFGLAGWLRSRLSGLLASLVLVEREQAWQRARVSSAVSAMGGLVSAVATAAAGVAVVSRRLSLGDFTLFIASVTGTQTAASGLLTQFGMMRQSESMYEHFLVVTQRSRDIVDGGLLAERLDKGLEFRDVWFRYDAEAPWVLAGLSMTIPAGCSVGLVGLNGAGKTTIAKLICRFYDPERGQILWNGRDIREYSVTSLRERIAIAFQDFMTYDLTARENVGLGQLRSLNDDAAIARATHLAGAGQIVAGLPQGLETALTRTFSLSDAGGQGTTLSGGQWQKLALARTLLRDRVDLVLLDEPSASLDAEAEHLVHQRIRAWRQGRTSIAVSHRLNTLRDSDIILVLSGGIVSESGTHVSLMAVGGEYARLFEMQASGYRDVPVLDAAVGRP